MKTFIFILYILFILILPQLYTWAVRESSYDPDSQGTILFLGGIITIILTGIFTIALINWNIISITL